MAYVFNKAEIKYIETNLSNKTLIKIASELSNEAGLLGDKKIKRQDIIDFFKTKLNRDLVAEKFK